MTRSAAGYFMKFCDGRSSSPCDRAGPRPARLLFRPARPRLLLASSAAPPARAIAPTSGPFYHFSCQRYHTDPLSARPLPRPAQPLLPAASATTPPARATAQARGPRDRSSGPPDQVVGTAPKSCPEFSSKSISAGILYLENHLISSLNDYCKRNLKETPQNGKLESFRLVWPGLLFRPSRITGPHLHNNLS
jgi:hypothetical protein